MRPGMVRCILPVLFGEVMCRNGEDDGRRMYDTKVLPDMDGRGCLSGLSGGNMTSTLEKKKGAILIY
jgi:hypothetical protein